MTLRRHHYVQIAAALADQKPCDEDGFNADARRSRTMQHEEDCIAVADTLAIMFPNFDRARFLAAAKGE
jgi:hypothetical protein